VQTGRRVAVIDWSGDWPGLDVAELLSAAGKEVTLVSSTLYPGEALHQYVRNVYLETMYRQGVTMMPHYELVEVQRDAVVLRNLFSNELKALEQIDTVVLALGRIADTELYDLLKGQVSEIYQVGDCLAARTMEEATYEAMRAALAL
jgi:pyruvate/2-oxoglutarate dehydrogenase complex dihydrolipoamide dehydrogenase (E3) component